MSDNVTELIALCAVVQQLYSDYDESELQPAISALQRFCLHEDSDLAEDAPFTVNDSVDKHDAEVAMLEDDANKVEDGVIELLSDADNDEKDDEVFEEWKHEQTLLDDADDELEESLGLAERVQKRFALEQSVLSSAKRPSPVENSRALPPLPMKLPPIVEPPATPAFKTPSSLSADAKFLDSLSPDLGENDAARHFRRRRDELAACLFGIYNRHVFNSQLPADLPITWSSRMRKTAGLCYYKRVAALNVASSLGEDKTVTYSRSVRIELSEKVVDRPARLRDTLLHELCHAGVWLINGMRGGHGPTWKAWVLRAEKAFPTLPPIRRCHSYEIAAKFTYRCMRCTQEVQRHSKSLDIERKVCGVCRGRFQLIVNTTRKRDAPTRAKWPRDSTFEWCFPCCLRAF